MGDAVQKIAVCGIIDIKKMVRCWCYLQRVLSPISQSVDINIADMNGGRPFDLKALLQLGLSDIILLINAGQDSANCHTDSAVITSRHYQ